MTGNATQEQVISLAENWHKLSFRHRAIKTNVSIPAILGGKQNVYFFPDVVLVIDGKQAGAIAYEQLTVFWDDTLFLESKSVPKDARIVGHSWQFVNKNGGPDRRFKNNHLVPQVLYQEMGLQSPGEFRKILQISQRTERHDFDLALNQLRTNIRGLKKLAFAGPSANRSVDPRLQ